MLSNPLCYEIITPESVGVPTSDIVLGKHSGRHALISRFEQLGHKFDADEIDDVYARFMELSHKKKNIYDQDLLALAAARTPTAIAA
jgi:2-isopropylmalate synthase